MTEWQPCPGFPAYEVSDTGLVRRVLPGPGAVVGRVLKPQRHMKGYQKVSLTGRKQRLVHQLVCEAFHGPPPPGHDVDHIDFDRANNHATNLRWLPVLVNKVRWRGPGRQDFEVLDERTPAPEDHIPMSEEEVDGLQRELHAAGW